MKIITIPDCFFGQVTPETVRPPLCLPELRCPRTQSSQKTRDSEEEAVDGKPTGQIGEREPRTGTNPAPAGQPKIEA